MHMHRHAYTAQRAHDKPAAWQVERCEQALESHEAVVEENRKLYNQVLDLKGNIRVFCRVRPLGTTGDMNQGVRTWSMLVHDAAHARMCMAENEPMRFSSSQSHPGVNGGCALA